MSPRTARRLLLLAIVLASLATLLLSGCGVTSEQRMWDSMQALHTADMEKRFQEAR